MVSREGSAPNPRLNPRTLSRCTIFWLLEDFDQSWTEEFGDVPVEVMDRASEFLAKALYELRTFRAAPPDWAARPWTSLARALERAEESSRASTPRTSSSTQAPALLD